MRDTYDPKSIIGGSGSHLDLHLHRLRDLNLWWYLHRLRDLNLWWYLHRLHNLNLWWYLHRLRNLNLWWDLHGLRLHRLRDLHRLRVERQQ